MGLGAALVGLWCIWWGIALFKLVLPLAERTWLKVPIFGADFWTQPDWAARVWDRGISPYDVDFHLFHYPPIVIHLFRWTLWFEPPTALRIWVVVLIALIVLGTWVAWRGRGALGLGQPPFLLVLAAVLFGFPVIFALERSNFDLITLAAMLGALAVLGTRLRIREVVAGALLAFGPWVKIYPGLLGVALIALRWWKALGGFVLGGIVIGVLEPEELVKSFKALNRLIAYTEKLEISGYETFYPWSHSISTAVRKAVVAMSKMDMAVPGDVPSSAVALVLLSPLFGWVTVNVYRRPGSDALAFPLMAWFVAAASYVPEVANDYSLVFLPIAIVGSWSRKDPWPIHLGLASALVCYQPFTLPISGFVLLGVKVAAVAAAGGSLVCRARELGSLHAAAITRGLDGNATSAST